MSPENTMKRFLSPRQPCGGSFYWIWPAEEGDGSVRLGGGALLPRWCEGCAVALCLVAVAVVFT